MSNPALNEKTWNRVQDFATTDTMTLDGTINKSGILIVLTAIGAYFGWNAQSPLLMMVAIVATLILSLVIIFKPQTASFLSQAYAVLEGVSLGTISAFYAVRFPGVVSNALIGTMGCFVLMLALYRLRIIQVTDKFRTVVIVATGAIAIMYLVNLVMMMFGSSMPMLHQASPVGIAFSVLVTGIAALNLALDFDMIEQAHARRAPKFMEWYCGFALLMTLVWLYIEMLRLMSKLSRK